MKKKNIVRILLLAILFAILMFVNAVLQNAWYSYLILALCFAFTVYAPRILRQKKRVLCVLSWVLFAVMLTSALTVCRSDRQVSFVANAYRSYKRMESHVYNAVTGAGLGRNAEGKSSESYDFSCWTPPKGYDQAEIYLPEARGYLLKKENGNHDKVVYYIHGGSYVVKYRRWYNDITLRFSVAAGDSDVFALDYRTAPEDVYPCALLDAVDGYEYLLSQGYEPKNIIVAGDSAGGGLSTALTMYLRDNGYPMFSKLVLSSPWLDLSQSGRSYTENATDDVLFGAFQEEMLPRPVRIPYYAGDGDLTDPYISPVYGTFEDFPSTFILAGSDEIFLSDSQTAYEKLSKSGCEVKYLEKHGMWHCYFVTFPWCRESAEAWELVQDFILG